MNELPQRFTFRQPAGEHERFARGAFRIGQTTRVTLLDQSWRTGTIVAAEYAPDGTWVDLEVELGPLDPA